MCQASRTIRVFSAFVEFVFVPTSRPKSELARASCSSAERNVRSWNGATKRQDGRTAGSHDSLMESNGEEEGEVGRGSRAPSFEASAGRARRKVKRAVTAVGAAGRKQR